MLKRIRGGRVKREDLAEQIALDLMNKSEGLSYYEIMSILDMSRHYILTEAILISLEGGE